MSGSVFYTGTAALFALCALATIRWCTSMSAMGGMTMPGGWTMSMMWMKMPGQTWTAAAADFLAMWIVMMVAMMLPSLVPALSRYRRALEGTGARVHLQTAAAGGGYFFVWTLAGLVVYLGGAALAAIEMQHVGASRAVPLASAAVIVVAGALQFTPWKARQLACCRGDAAAPRAARVRVAGAWRHGLRLGIACVKCCLNLTLVLIAAGLMDLRAMSLVTLAITAERLAPVRLRTRAAVGWLLTGTGVLLLGIELAAL